MTPRTSRSLVVFFSVLACFVGCDGGDAPVDASSAGDGGSEDPSALRREVLGALGENVILPALRDFAEQAEALEVATAAYAADPSADNRAAAQAAWRDAAASWQQAELMQVGPAGMSGTGCGVVGAMELRDEIYSWNLTSTCRIDQETVADAHADTALLDAELVNVRGLDAMEYLLFVETDDNTCGALSPINDEGTWEAERANIGQRRATYAHTAAQLVLEEARGLRDAWEPSGGDFLADWRGAGTDGSAYDSSQRALDDLATAMLYLDTATRDMKVGDPAGITCMDASCIDSLETPWANHDKQAILANLDAFGRLFHGESPDAMGLGIDDLLLAVGADTLVADLSAALAAAVTAVEAIPGTLREAIEADAPEITTAYDALGTAQRLFKVDVVTALDIDVQSCTPGDND